VLVATGGALVTLAAATLPLTGFAYESTAFHVAIDTAVSIVGLLAAWLLLGRFVESRSLRDLLLVGAFLMLLLANLGFSTAPAVVGESASEFATWTSTAGRLFGAVALVGAAFCPTGVQIRRRRAPLLMGICCAVIIGVTGVAVALLEPVLPTPVDTATLGDQSSLSQAAQAPLVSELLIAATVLFFLAALGFARGMRRSEDELTWWLAAATTLGGFAFLNYSLFPSLYSDWVYTGDLLRLAAYLALLAGALRQIGIYREKAALSAQASERERIARDIHDGLS
jgi:signal transduction histidine kinase